MSNFWVIWRREWTACFLSPVAYVTMVVFLAVANGTFFVGTLRNLGGYEPLAPLLFAAIFLWMPVLVTVVSMRLFAEEKRQGTLEMLMTAPVTEAEVVLGKYAGALSFTLLIMAPAVSSIFLLEWLSPGLRLVDLDVGAIAGGGAILALSTALAVAIGLLVSLMTCNQIVSAICCFAAICTALMFGWLLSMVPGVSRHAADYVAATTHIDDFARGSVDAGPILLYVSATVFFLFVAVRVLESRRWR